MLKAPLKLSLLVLWVAVFIPPVWIAKKLKSDSRQRLVILCYKGLLHITGIRLQVHGEASPARPMLLVTNHLSYMDIAILGSQLPVRFTPKSEIADWPVIGGICRLTNAVFIDRRTEKIRDMAENIKNALSEGAIVCMFPEASTGNGLHMLPFKSGFFSLAEENVEGSEVIVQPAAIVYTRISRLPIDSTQWPSIAWYGDMDLLPHMKELMRLGPIDVELVFLPPMSISEYGNRKALAEACQETIAAAVEEARQRRFMPASGVSRSWILRLLKRRERI